MKIVFFNRFFAPDPSATSQLLGDLALHLAASGRHVHVVATGESPAGPERREGVTIHRVAPVPARRGGLWTRAAAYARYAHGARRAAATLLEAGDVAVAMTDPPMLSAALSGIARGRGARTVVWLHDLFPEAARAYGIPGAGGPFGSLLLRLRDRSLTAADAVVAVGEDMAARIRERGCVAADRLHVVPNWADGRAVAPMPPETNPLRARWAGGKTLLVGYSGNLGRVHEFETLLGAARRLRDGVAFVIVGDGPRRGEVERAVASLGLANLRMEAPQERAALALTLSAPDVHMVSLRPEFEGLVQPSKLYGVMAAGRPCVFVGHPAGETARVLRECGAGVTVERGDEEGLARTLGTLRDDPELRARMGDNARRAFEARYDMPIALARWERVLAGL